MTYDFGSRILARVAMAVGVVVVASGCVGTQYQPTASGSSPPVDPLPDQTVPVLFPPKNPQSPGSVLDSPSSNRLITVGFATDRARAGKPSEFSGARAERVTFGFCEVAIPPDHRLGKIERPLKWFPESVERHIVITQTSTVSEEQFFKTVASAFAENPDKRKALIFIHGYNVTFADAARRTAQMAYDLEFKGVAAFYSWPSQGEEALYSFDETNIEWSQSNIERFLSAFLEKSDVQEVYIVAHSMGNRAMTRAVAAVVTKQPDYKSKIKEIILAAPDIDADVFKRDIAPQLIASANRVTLYVSSQDKALKLSKTFHGGYQRVGDPRPSIVLTRGLDTIDASALDTDFLGHSYYGDNKSVIADIYGVINGATPASRRFGLRSMRTPEGSYWLFRP